MKKKIVCAATGVLMLIGLCSCAERSEQRNVLSPTVRTTQPSTKAPTMEDTTQKENTPVVDHRTLIKGEEGAATLSGLSSLPQVEYPVMDPQNSRGLSEKKICHSHGPASGGKAHPDVVAFQKDFDKFDALTLDTKTKEKVLYLTFDCGWEHDNLTSRVLDILEEKEVSAAFFCTLTHIKQQPELIGRMIQQGHIVGNHSVTHPSFAAIDRTQMVHEIQDLENYLRKNYGYAAKYFRFPAGEYNESALDVIHQMGYHSIFWSVAYDDWNVDVIRGGQYANDIISKRLHPGAILLLHAVSPDNAEGLGDIIDNARAQGYEFRSLEDYYSTVS